MEMQKNLGNLNEILKNFLRVADKNIYKCNHI